MPVNRTYNFLPLGPRQSVGSPSHMGDVSGDDRSPVVGSEDINLPVAKGKKTGKLPPPPPPGEVRYSPARNNGNVNMGVRQHAPQRTPSKIAHDVLENSVYRHKYAEQTRRKRKRTLVLAAITAAAVLLLLLVIIVISVVLTRGGGGGDEGPTGRFGGRVGLLTVPLSGPDGVLNIRYNVSDASTYTPMVSQIDGLWDEYEQRKLIALPRSNCTSLQDDYTSVDATNGSSNGTTTPATIMPEVTCPPRAAAAFPLDTLGTECSRNNDWFGYGSGMPCIALALRVHSEWDVETCLDLKPQTSTNNVTSSTPSTTTSKAGTYTNIPMSCTYLTNASVPYQIRPTYGFLGETLADRHRPRYLDPLVVVRITDPLPEQDVTLECSVCPGYRKGDAPDPRYTVRITVRIHHSPPENKVGR